MTWMAKVRNTNKLWTVREVAHHFRRTERTIYRWINEGFVQNVLQVRDGYLIPDQEIQRLQKSFRFNFDRP